MLRRLLEETSKKTPRHLTSSEKGTKEGASWAPVQLYNECNRVVTEEMGKKKCGSQNAIGGEHISQG